MDPKIYAVRVGRTPGLYDNWPDCEAQVKGFKGAEYKSFRTKPDALAFMNQNKEIVTMPTDHVATAYVDGSFNKDTNCYGSGYILFFEGETYEYSEKGNDPSLATMRNVAGEIMASTKAIEKAITLGANGIEIYYDYEGIEKWTNGAWKANKTGTMNYSSFVSKARNEIIVNFHKVEAHTGVEYNEVADRLAKKAVGIPYEEINLTNKVVPLDFNSRYPFLKEKLSQIAQLDKESRWKALDDIFKEYPNMSVEDISKMFEYLK